jgi:hypothetical protein
VDERFDRERELGAAMVREIEEVAFRHPDAADQPGLRMRRAAPSA